MKDRIMHALDSVRLKSNAAAVVLCELSPNHETAFVLAIAPRGLMAQGMPFPAQADTAPRLESDPLQLSQVLPVALRLALSAPASHAWTQSLQGTRLQITLAWSQPPTRRYCTHWRHSSTHSCAHRPSISPCASNSALRTRACRPF